MGRGRLAAVVASASAVTAVARNDQQKMKDMAGKLQVLRRGRVNVGGEFGAAFESD